MDKRKPSIRESWHDRFWLHIAGYGVAAFVACALVGLLLWWAASILVPWWLG